MSNYKRRVSPLTPKAEEHLPPPNHTKGPKADWILTGSCLHAKLSWVSLNVNVPQFLYCAPTIMIGTIIAAGVVFTLKKLTDYLKRNANKSKIIAWIQLVC